MGGLGQTDEEGKKFAKFDDVVAMCETAVKTPDSQGTYADYVELLELYDILCNLGDEIPKVDVQKMFAEICDPEDEDGMMSWSTDRVARCSLLGDSQGSSAPWCCDFIHSIISCYVILYPVIKYEHCHQCMVKYI